MFFLECLSAAGERVDVLLKDRGWRSSEEVAVEQRQRREVEVERLSFFFTANLFTLSFLSFEREGEKKNEKDAARPPPVALGSLFVLARSPLLCSSEPTPAAEQRRRGGAAAGESEIGEGLNERKLF